MASEEELIAKLERWMAGRREPPSIFDVIDADDCELLAAYVLKGFRAAAAAAVNDRIRREGVKLFPTSPTNIAAAVMRVFDGLARVWSLSKEEQICLLGLHNIGELQALWNMQTEGLPPVILERIALLLDIFKAINTLLPEPHAADAWIRSANRAPLFADRSALDLMLVRGSEGMYQIRAYLRSQCI